MGTTMTAVLGFTTIALAFTVPTLAGGLILAAVGLGFCGLAYLAARR